MRGVTISIYFTLKGAMDFIQSQLADFNTCGWLNEYNMVSIIKSQKS